MTNLPVYSKKEILYLGEKIIAPALNFNYREVNDSKGYKTWFCEDRPKHYYHLFSYLDKPDVYTPFLIKFTSLYLYSFLHFKDGKCVDKRVFNISEIHPHFREDENRLYAHIVWHLCRTQHYEIQDYPPLSELFPETR